MKTFLYILWIIYSIIFLVALWLYISSYTSITSFLLFAASYVACCIYVTYSLRTKNKNK